MIQEKADTAKAYGFAHAKYLIEREKKKVRK